MSDIGASLRKAREARQASVADMAQQLSVPPQWLEDLEDGKFEAFGNAVHAQAAIRVYASGLGLDPEALLRDEAVVVPSTGATFEPRVAAEATRGEQVRYLTMQALRSRDASRTLAVVAGLEVLAGIGLLIVRLGS
ncbi:MAG TPA: helix-turn-helix transcriptional regulator [Euzebya sp.]|nr:helix-turn-helix transcriptional regulator [Euzebya sp.]